MKNSLFINQSLINYKHICDTHDIYYSESLFYSLIDFFSHKSFIDNMNKNVFILPIIKKFFIDTYVLYTLSRNKIKKCICSYVYRKRKSCNFSQDF